MEFEWHEAKEKANRQAHGVAFHEASTTFYDALALLMADEDHSIDEERFILLARSQRDRLLVTVFTRRERRLRIISSRRATPREVRSYEEGI